MFGIYFTISLPQGGEFGEFLIPNIPRYLNMRNGNLNPLDHHQKVVGGRERTQPTKSEPPLGRAMICLRPPTDSRWRADTRPVPPRDPPDPPSETIPALRVSVVFFFAFPVLHCVFRWILLFAILMIVTSIRRNASHFTNRCERRMPVINDKATLQTE